MKRILKISAIVIVIGTVTGLLAFVKSRPGPVSCANVSIDIDVTEDRNFITEGEINNIIQAYCDSSSLDPGITLRELETQISQLDPVKGCEIYTKVNGSLNIKVTQRTPIGRIINSDGQTFYMDSDGVLMKAVKNRPSRVLIVNGMINERFTEDPYYLTNDSLAARSVFDDIYNMVAFIDRNAFWRKMIEQVFVTSDQEFILIPKVGMHEVRFGKAEHIQGKFNKLEKFYRKAITANGWMAYRIVDIRYKGLVACSGGDLTITQDTLQTNNEH